MKRPTFMPRTMAGLSLLVLLSACSKSDSNEDPAVDPVADKAILSTFVDTVVLDTYQDLADQSIIGSAGGRGKTCGHPYGRKFSSGPPSMGGCTCALGAE
jgi:hypothetical protein